MANKSIAGFFNTFSGVLGELGRGWYPEAAGALGVPPFWRASSKSGQEITVPKALQLAAVWACVRKKSEIVASLPLIVYRRSNAGQRSVAADYPLYGLLHDKPNGLMSAFEWICMTMASLELWGNAYTVKTRSAGELVALMPLRPEYTTPYLTPGGELRYRFARGAEVDDYGQDDVLHVKGFGLDGLTGLSPIAMARQSLGRAMATDEASSRIFQSGLTASGFVTTPQALKPDQRDGIRQTIQRFTGSANAGRVMVLENGMSYQQISMNPADAQMLETKNFNIEEICRWHGMPPQLIGHADKASSWASSLEGMNLQFLTYTLMPVLRSIEQAINTRVIPPADRAGYFVKFNVTPLLRGDSAARAALYASALQNGWMTSDEVRALEDFNSVDGADQLRVQSNMMPLANLGKAPPAPTPIAETKK